jgi:trk system potassium uptake protein TrkA
VERVVGKQPATLVAIMRGDETIIPDGATTVQAGDHVFMIGESRAMPKILGFLGHDTSPMRTVMIVGAGPISRHLAQHLSEARIQVKMIEVLKEKAERTATELDKVMVLHGDATDVELLESENVDEMDAFIAASNDEETNLMSCLLARHMGAKKTIAVMRRSNYVPLVHSLGIDAAISVRLNTASAIMKFVRRGEIISFAQLKDNEAEALELVAHADSKIAGTPLAKVAFPDDAVIGAIIRGSKIIVPRGDTVIEDGDRVVVFALPSAAGAVGKLFA